jgi:MerR family transcriptional regulator, light-induced transcriptional regulator
MMRRALGTRKASARASHDSLPLRTVSAITGLSPDLIRAWEKRYGVVAPMRGARGARLYTAADVDHLRLLARAVATGRAIGDVARFGHEQLEQLTRAGATEAPPPQNGIVDRVLERLRSFDHGGVASLLVDALIGLGCREFVHQVAAPLLDEVGRLWERGELSIASERLVSGMLHNVLASLIQVRRPSGSRTVVLATPTGERHEFGILFVALLAVDAGLDVAYLGLDVPAREIVATVLRTDAILVGLSLVSDTNRANAVEQMRQIESSLPAATQLWIGGRDAKAVAARSRPFRGTAVALEQAEVDLARLARSAGRNPAFRPPQDP